MSNIGSYVQPVSNLGWYVQQAHCLNQLYRFLIACFIHLWRPECVVNCNGVLIGDHFIHVMENY